MLTVCVTAGLRASTSNAVIGMHVALVLSVKPPGEQWRVFNTNDFRPPSNPADWKYPNPANLESTEDPCKVERRPQRLLQRPSPQ